MTRLAWRLRRPDSCGSPLSSGSTFGYRLARWPRVADQRHGGDQVVQRRGRFRRQLPGLSTEPSAAIRATKPSCRGERLSAVVASFSRSPRTSAPARGRAAGQQADQVEATLCVARVGRSLRSCLFRMASSSTLQCRACSVQLGQAVSAASRRNSSRTPGRKSSSR